MFHKTQRHGFINLDFVTRITTVMVAGPDPDGVANWDIGYCFSNGSVLTDSNHYGWPRIPSSIVAAQPGYFVITAQTDENGSLFTIPVPIIGWMHDATDNGIVPITFDGNEYGGYPILVPDGRVLDGMYSDEVAWLAGGDAGGQAAFDKESRLKREAKARLAPVPDARGGNVENEKHPKQEAKASPTPEPDAGSKARPGPVRVRPPPRDS